MPIIDAWYKKAGVPDGVQRLSDLFKIVEHWATLGLGRVWSRGEPKDYKSTSLLPRIARNKKDRFTPVGSGRILTQEEAANVRKCQDELKDARFMDPFLEKFVPGITPHDVNWIPLAQHYGYDTRLLDVTRNLLVALFFAVDSNQDEDGFVYIFPESSYRPQEKPLSKIQAREIASAIPDTYDELFEDAARYPQSSFGFLLCPFVPNSRIVAQQGAFIWWDPIGSKFPGQMIPILIRQDSKKTMLEALSHLGVDRDGLFPYEP
jgi:hypothetical protein